MMSAIGEWFPSWPVWFFILQMVVLVIGAALEFTINGGLVSSILLGALAMLPTVLPTVLWMAFRRDVRGGGSGPMRWSKEAFEQLPLDLQQHVHWHNRAALLMGAAMTCPVVVDGIVKRWF